MADITHYPESQQVLAKLVDDFGIEGLFDGLIHICREQAEHSRTALADDFAARLWDLDAALLKGAQSGLRH
jgi:hypothetical protein